MVRHHISFLSKVDLLSKAKENGNFVVNCPWKSVEELDAYFPAGLRRVIAENEMNLFTIDAYVVAVSVGLPSSRINQVMHSTFFELSQVLAKQGREQQLDAAVDRMHGTKYPKLVTSNKAALHAAPQNLNKEDYPASWLSAVKTEVSLKTHICQRHSTSGLLTNFQSYAQESDYEIWRRVASQGILNLEERLTSDSQSSRNVVWRTKCQSEFQAQADRA